MLAEQLLQVVGTVGDMCGREAHVFVDDCAAFWSQVTDDAEQALAHPPVALDEVLVSSELDRMQQGVSATSSRTRCSASSSASASPRNSTRRAADLGSSVRQ